MRNLPRYRLGDARAEDNIGDLLGPALLARMIGPGTTTLTAAETPKLISVGSCLTVAYRPGDTVWGAGIVSDGGRVTVTEPDKILAVRGPMTHARLAGMPQRHVTYGDPALLCPLYWQAPTKPRKYLGILPHWIDEGHTSVYQSDRFLRLRITDPIEQLVDQLAECHTVISTSLHGIILAEAYRVPGVIWDASWSGQIVGGGFKFFDYFSATGRHVQGPGLLPRLDDYDLAVVQLDLTRALERAL